MNIQTVFDKVLPLNDDVKCLFAMLLRLTRIPNPHSCAGMEDRRKVGSDREIMLCDWSELDSDRHQETCRACTQHTRIFGRYPSEMEIHSELKCKLKSHYFTKAVQLYADSA